MVRLPAVPVAIYHSGIDTSAEGVRLLALTAVETLAPVAGCTYRVD